MVERVLPPHLVVAVSTRVEIEAVPAAAEAAAIRRAVASRRREFATARACARAALARLGVPPVPIPQGPAGEPCWPAGVVGSITHCEGYRAAAVARASDLGGLGIDAEPNLPLPAGVLAEIASAEERSHLRRRFEEAPAVRWDRLLFSAKEAVFKLWYPLTGEKLGFEDAGVEFDLAGTFTASLRAGRPALRGRWSDGEGLVVAGICLARGRALQSAAVTDRARAWNGTERQDDRPAAPRGGAARFTEGL